MTPNYIQKIKKIKIIITILIIFKTIIARVIFEKKNLRNIIIIVVIKSWNPEDGPTLRDGGSISFVLLFLLSMHFWFLQN